MKTIFTVIVCAMLASCAKQAKENFAPNGNSEVASKKKKTESPGTVATITLTNNGGGSFGVDYGGATDVVWMFFRAGDSLGVSGNVYPLQAQSFYLNPVTTFQSNVSGTFYQAVVVTGTTGGAIVGADWVFNYSNVVQ